jgi:hypothetical protein
MALQPDPVERGALIDQILNSRRIIVLVRLDLALQNGEVVDEQLGVRIARARRPEPIHHRVFTQNVDEIVFAICCRRNNDEDSIPWLRRFLEMPLPFKPVNLGDARHGGGPGGVEIDQSTIPLESGHPAGFSCGDRRPEYPDHHGRRVRQPRGG